VFLDLDLTGTNWPALVVSILCIAFAGVSLALFLGNFVLVVRNYNEFAATFQGAVILLSGAIIPHSSLPEPLGVVAHALPVTSGLTAFRGAIAGMPLSEAASSLAPELGVGAAFLLLGFLTQRIFVRVAKRTGTLHSWAN
jgi:ABC-type polysaccharide/polyol phosphate export permease